jgi:hypothetical protein
MLFFLAAAVDEERREVVFGDDHFKERQIEGK